MYFDSQMVYVCLLYGCLCRYKNIYIFFYFSHIYCDSFQCCVYFCAGPRPPSAFYRTVAPPSRSGQYNVNL